VDRWPLTVNDYPQWLRGKLRLWHDCG
jgi:hypothetical protein